MSLLTSAIHEARRQAVWQFCSERRATQLTTYAISDRSTGGVIDVSMGEEKANLAQRVRLA
jgi:hypothetical protein